MLETAYYFLYSKKGAGNGTAIHPKKREYIFMNQGQCLHCGLILTKKNCSTEHIHDLALGGKNHDENKILICKNCNSLRNQLMHQYLGTPSFHKGFPGNWDRVKKYLLWNAITADEGHDAGRIFPILQSNFENLLSLHNKNPVHPAFFFGRGASSNLIITKNQQTKLGFFTKIFDKIFGYNPRQFEKHITNSPYLESTNYSKGDQNLNLKFPEVKKEFYDNIMNVMESVDGEIHLSMFSKLLNESLLKSGIGNLTLKQYANAMGIPKSRSCIQIIEHYFPNLISYRREGAGIMIWLNREVFEGQDLEEE